MLYHALIHYARVPNSLYSNISMRFQLKKKILQKFRICFPSPFCLTPSIDPTSLTLSLLSTYERRLFLRFPLPPLPPPNSALPAEPLRGSRHERLGRRPTQIYAWVLEGYTVRPTLLCRFVFCDLQNVFHDIISGDLLAVSGVTCSNCTKGIEYLIKIESLSRKK